MNVTKVAWTTWAGNQRKTHWAFFKDKASAEKFIVSLADDKKIEDVELTEGLNVRDVC